MLPTGGHQYHFRLFYSRQSTERHYNIWMGPTRGNSGRGKVYIGGRMGMIDSGVTLFKGSGGKRVVPQKDAKETKLSILARTLKMKLKS
jgi:hypothetical protein